MYQGDYVSTLPSETDRTVVLLQNFVQSHDLWPHVMKTRKRIEILEQLAYLMLNSHHAFSTQYQKYPKNLLSS